MEMKIPVFYELASQFDWNPELQVKQGNFLVVGLRPGNPSCLTQTRMRRTTSKSTKSEQ